MKLKFQSLIMRTIVLNSLLLNFLTPSAQAADLQLIPCKLPSLNKLYHQDVGWPRDVNSIPSKGVQDFLILLIDFPDASAAPGDLQNLPQLMELKYVENFYSTISKDTFKPVFHIFPKTVTMDNKSDYYGANLTQDSISNGEFQSHILVRDALDKISSEIDLSKYEGAIAVVDSGNSLSGNIASATSVDKDTNHKSGILQNYLLIGRGALKDNQVSPWKLLAHEINHLLGITDLYVYSKDGWWQGKSPGPFGQQGFLRGDSASDSLAYNRWLLGWIPEKRIKCYQSITRSLVLNLVAQDSEASGYELVLMRIDSNKLLVFESPKSKGFASNTFPNSILIYTVDNSLKIGEGPIRIIPKNDPIAVSKLTPTLPDWERFKNAALLSGDGIEYGNLLFINSTSNKTSGTTQLRILIGSERSSKVIQCAKHSEIKFVAGYAAKCPNGFQKIS